MYNTLQFSRQINFWKPLNWKPWIYILQMTAKSVAFPETILGMSHTNQIDVIPDE